MASEMRHGWDGRDAGLLDVARELASSHDPEAILAYLVNDLVRRFSAERGFAILTNQAGGLDIRVAHNVSASGAVDPERAVCHTIAAGVARSRTPVLIRDASSDPVLRERTSVMGQGIRSVMCAPMIARGELMGVIYVDNLSKGDAFTDADLGVLTLLSAYAGAALYNARLIAAGADAGRMREQSEKLTALSQLAAGVAHDFKNVLWAIQTRLELLTLRSDRAEMDRDIAAAHEAVELGRKIVAEMSQFAELGFSAPTHLVDVGRLVRAVAEALLPDPAEKGCVLKLDLAEGIHVRAHESHLSHIAMNLIRNALDAMPDGGTLSLSVAAAGGQCVLQVEDTGAGIPDEAKVRLFEPFFTTKGQQSMGLGLSLVQALVARLGGSITVESRLGKGARFAVHLPLAADEGNSGQP